MSSIRINRIAAADSLPATNVPGFAADLQRLRGKYLSNCSRLRRKPRNVKPETDLKPAAHRQKLETRNPKPETAVRPAFIDDGD